MISKRLFFALLAASLLILPPALFAQSRSLKKIQVGVPASFVEELDKSGFVKKSTKNNFRL